MKYIVATALVLITALPAATEELASRLSACAAIEDSAVRLDCYDDLAHELNTGRPSNRGSDVTVPVVPDVGLAQFGRERIDSVPEDMEARIALVKRASSGRQTLQLENGMVWREREISKRDIAPNQAVVIARRRWSYSMLLVDQNRRVTVERID